MEWIVYLQTDWLLIVCAKFYCVKIEINTGTKKFTTTSTLSPEERLEKIKKKGMEEIPLINSKIQELQLVLDSTALFKDSRVPEAMHHEINNRSSLQKDSHSLCRTDRSKI